MNSFLCEVMAGLHTPHPPISTRVDPLQNLLRKGSK
jgi:hypothetical protein